MAVKVIGLLKRHPALSPQQFRDYYESRHRIIGEKYLAGFASRYRRRYLQGFADPLTGAAVAQAYDVLLEIWYRDEEAFAAASRRFTEPEVAAEIAEDEDKLFDRACSRFFVIDRECESDLKG